MNKYSQIVTNYLNTDRGFSEVKEILGNNIKGDTWIVGGKVFRPIIKELYNIPFSEDFDFDLITENQIDPSIFKLSKGWGITKTGLGEPRIINGSKQIDLIFLDHSVNPYVGVDLEKLSPIEKLNSYFSKVPLNIQMIAFDIRKRKIIGKDGIAAIEKRELKVNCIEECIQFCKRRKISIRKFLDTKVTGDIFNRIYPEFTDTEDTHRYYEVNAEKYAEKYSFSDFITKYFPEEIAYFLGNLKGKKILDVGAGFGRDSVFFKKRGFDPYAIDTSKEMIKLCGRARIKGEIQNIENCSLDDEQFDGIYAYCSLLHIPKRRIFNSLARISELLKPNGLFFIGMLEGNREEIHEDRLFSKYSKTELESILKEYFKIVKFKKFSVRNQTYLNFVCSKNLQNGKGC